MPVTQSVSDRWQSISDFLAEWLETAILPEKEQAIFDRYYHSYRKYFGPYVRKHYAGQSLEIMDLLSELRGVVSARVLEVGAGCGTEALWFALANASVMSIDIDQDRLLVARSRQGIIENQFGRNLDLEFKKVSFFEAEIAQEFDIIWMEQTFHHLEPREKVYSNVSRALKPHGYVVISDTNGWNPLIQAALLRKRGWETIVEKALSDGSTVQYGDERITVPTVLKRGFEKTGIDLVSLRYYRMLPNAGWAQKFAFIERKVPNFLKTFLFTHYNYVGQKKRF